MHRRAKLPMLVEDSLTAVELPYAGELALLALMPAICPPSSGTSARTSSRRSARAWSG
jgi:hypothetical protein